MSKTTIKKNRRSVQDQFLEELCRREVLVFVYLLSGVRLCGYIKEFDQFVITLKDGKTQMVYKHSISTIIPQEEKGKADRQEPAPSDGESQ